VLAHLAPVPWDALGGPTVRRALDLVGTLAMLDRIARAPRESPRARTGPDRGDCGRVPVAGHRREDPWWAGWSSTWTPPCRRAFIYLRRPDPEEGLRLPPVGAWLANTRECLAMLLRPSNAGPDTFTGHKEVLAAAIRQVPACSRDKILIRAGGVAASHELTGHLISLSSPRWAVLFICGWMITAADKDAIRQVPASAWKPGTGQGGAAEEDKDVAEITDLMSRAGNWPEGCGDRPPGQGVAI